MRSILSFLVAVGAIGALARGAAADEVAVPITPTPPAAAVIAVEPGPPIDEPLITEEPPPVTVAVDEVTPVPPPPPPETPNEALIVIASGLTARMPEGAGTLADLGRGAALSLSWLQRRGNVPTGVAVRGLFLGGRDSRIYDLDVQMIASAKLGHRVLVPFVGIGLGFGTVRFADKNKAASGMALGPVGGLGVHGFVGDLYWRAELAAIGTGAAVITGGLSLGWVFGS